MATKKAASTKKPSTSKALVPWTEKFAAYAKKSSEQIKAIGAGGVGISFGHGSISVGGAEIRGGKLETIILGYCAHNRWFKSKYSKDDKQPPDCYAYAEAFDDPGMAPFAAVKDKQSPTCGACPKNVFGTADTGRGKACGNTIRLGCLVAKDVEDGDSAKAAEMATGGVSPTNLKRFKTYVKMLEEEHGRPPWAVVTEISSYDDKDTQIRVEFKMVDLIEDDGVLLALEKRFAGVQDLLQVAYPAPGEKEKEKAKAPAAGKSARFSAGGKRRD